MAYLSIPLTTVCSRYLCVFHRYSLLLGAVGLELARLADLPSDILQEGQRVAAKLAELQKKQEEESEGSQIALRRKVLLRVSASRPSARE